MITQGILTIIVNVKKDFSKFYQTNKVYVRHVIQNFKDVPCVTRQNAWRIALISVIIVKSRAQISVQ